MNQYRLITIVDPIIPELARGLPPNLASFIASREGTETTIAKLFTEIRDLLGMSNIRGLRAFPPTAPPGAGAAYRPAILGSAIDPHGSISLTLPMPRSAGKEHTEMSWTLCRFRYVGPELLIAKRVTS